VFKKDTLKTLARYVKEFSGLPSGMLTDVVNLAHDELTKDMDDGGGGGRRKKGKSIEEVKEEKEAAKESHGADDEVVDFAGTIEKGASWVRDQAGEHGVPNPSSTSVKFSGKAGLKPVLEYVSDKIRGDFSEYHQRIWDLVIGSGMTYDAVADRLGRDGVTKSHMTVGNDFKKFRTGSKKDGKTTGMGYYVESWWAEKHNTDKYKYVPPANDDEPDYVHEDGTVDSLKSVWETRRTYYTPCDDCYPEYRYCLNHGLKSFRLVFINFKYTTDKFIIKVIDVEKATDRVILMPSMYQQ
jgi:hypothetical protein